MHSILALQIVFFHLQSLKICFLILFLFYRIPVFTKLQYEHEAFKTEKNQSSNTICKVNIKIRFQNESYDFNKPFNKFYLQSFRGYHENITKIDGPFKSSYFGRKTFFNFGMLIIVRGVYVIVYDTY